MSAGPETIEAPLDGTILARRWEELLRDPLLQEVAGKVELTQWGEILVNPPVGKIHGLAAARVVTVLKDRLGGHPIVEVGIVTAQGVRAPDVAWCSDAFLAAHPEDGAFSAAPELCIEIASPSNALPKLREKAQAYVAAGAIEAWILFPVAKTVEMFGAGGRIGRTVFALDPADLFDR